MFRKSSIPKICFFTYLKYLYLPKGDLALQTEDDIAVSGKLVELWTQFALTGSPTPQVGVWAPINRTSADKSLNYAIIDHKKVRDTAQIS